MTVLSINCTLTPFLEKMKMCCFHNFGFSIFAFAFLLTSCENSHSLFWHGIAIAPTKRDNEYFFAKGLSGSYADTLIIMSDEVGIGTLRGKINVKIENFEIVLQFPDDFGDASKSWLRNDTLKREIYDANLGGYDGLRAASGRPIKVSINGLPNNIDVYLWRLPKWYLKR